MPATSLALPVILDIGVVAANESIEASLSRKGMYGITEGEMLRAFETAMAQPTPHSGEKGNRSAAHIILGLEPTQLALAVASANHVYWYADARFALLRSAVEVASAASSSSKGSGGGFMSLLKSMQDEGDAEAVLGAIARHAVKRCSSILMTPVENFELEGKSIASYGLDSMIGAELRNWLFREFGLDIGFQTLLGPKLSFRELAGIIEKGLSVLTKNSTSERER